MKKLRVEAADRHAGARADAFLAAETDLSRSFLEKRFEAGQVLLGGAPVKKNRRMGPGEVLEILLPDPEPAEALPADIPLDVVYEDGDLIVINKPRGLVVHPAAGHLNDTLVNALLAHCGGELSGIGGVLRPGIVHRLDRDTSGLLVAAKTDAAHRSLAGQIQRRTFVRIYESVVLGGFREDSGRVERPIGRHPKDRKRMAVVPGGRPAATVWEVLARYRGYTHIRCRLESGRTHQIRVHMASIGHPVAGDPVYGPGRDELGLGGQCLHARSISFAHPSTGEVLSFTSELPEYFQKALTTLKRRL